MKSNMGALDRTVRIVIAAAVAVLLAVGTLHGALGIVLAIIGAIFLVTGVVGFCPLYALFRLSTKRARAS